MFHPVKMAKVRMIGLSADLPPALSLWRRLGVIELTTSPFESLGLQKGQPLEVYDKLSEHLVRVRGVKNTLIPTEVTPIHIKNSVEEAQKIFIGPKILEIRNELKELKKKIGPLEARKKELERLTSLDINLSKKPTEIQYYLLSCIDKELPILKKAISKVSSATTWLIKSDPIVEKSSLVLIAAPNGVDISSASKAYSQIKIPEMNGTPKQALLDVQTRLEKIVQLTKELNMKLKELSEKHYSRLVAISEALSSDAELARESSKFANTAQCFYATGWIKDRDYTKFKNTTEKLLKNQISIQKVSEKEHHFKDAPTVLENPRIAGPFQFLVEFLGMPKATELDPSMFTLITIPLAYGLIVGDAGYALLSILIATLISMKSKKGEMLWQFARIWQIGAIPTFIFGVLFDEYFAFSHKAFLGQSYYSPVIHRVSNVEGLLLMTIVVGWIYIALGFILGAINEWNHSKKHAAAKLTWIVVQIGGTLAVAFFLLNAVPVELGLIGTAMLLLGMVALAILEGPIGLVEVPGLAANIMSFARIAAVGVGGVILAEAVNSLLLPNTQMLLTAEGIILFITMSIAYALAHAANAFIAMFEGFIHGARLSVVEFFQKFFHGGGKPFNPFILKRRYTLDSAQSEGNLD